MNEYSKFVKTLAKDGKTIASEMTPEEAHLLHMVLGVSGESGELVDAVKKHVIYKKPIDRENMIEELGDLEFYIEGLRQGLGLTREECVEANMAKLRIRYGEKYSNEAAQIRKDKLESI